MGAFEKQAATILGEDVLASAMVTPRGYNMKRGVGMGVGGLVGAAVATGMGNKGITSPADHRGRMQIMLTPSRLVFFERKGGLLKDKLGQLLYEVPRTEVSSFTVGGGLASTAVTVGLSDGTAYTLETPRAAAKRARAVGDALGLPAVAGT